MSSVASTGRPPPVSRVLGLSMLAVFATTLFVRAVDPVIPRIAAYYDEPFANSSVLAAYFCSLMARQSGVDLLLGGDGGDELFAGNERYESDKVFALYHRLPRLLRRSVIEPVARLLPREHKWLGLPRRYVQRARIPNPERSFSYNFFLSFPVEEIFDKELLAHGCPAPPTSPSSPLDRRDLLGRVPPHVCGR